MFLRISKWIVILGLYALFGCAANETSVFKYCEVSEGKKIRNHPILISFYAKKWINSDVSSSVIVSETDKARGIIYPITISIPKNINSIDEKETWQFGDFIFYYERDHENENDLKIIATPIDEKYAGGIDLVNYKIPVGITSFEFWFYDNGYQYRRSLWARCGKKAIRVEDIM